jgi:hypothetical protein
MIAPDAHELLFMVRDFFLLLWNRAVAPVAKGEIPPEQGVSRFLGETWTCLEDIKDFNPTRLDAELRQEYAKALEIVHKQSTGPATSRPRRMTLAAANSKATELAKVDPAFLYKSQRAWADAIGCSDGLITKLELWKAKQKRAGNEPKQTRSPKAVSLTNKVLAVTPDREEELQRLICEQNANLEPSPLDPDPPDHPRKVKHHKKL